jgi:circadian clock protein KaiB
MKSTDQSGGPAKPEPSALVTFRLYIAGGAPNSLEAIANLKSICDEFLPNNHQIETIDVLQEPLRAVNDGVFVTPMLIKVSPIPVRQMLGNLSNRATVLLTLDL